MLNVVPISSKVRRCNKLLTMRTNRPRLLPLEFTQRILALMLEFRVWAECRPTHENEVHSSKLIADLDTIEEREVKQGSSSICCYSLSFLLASVVTFLRQSSRTCYFTRSTSSGSAGTNTLLILQKILVFPLSLSSPLSAKP